MGVSYKKYFVILFFVNISCCVLIGLWYSNYGHETSIRKIWHRKQSAPIPYSCCHLLRNRSMKTNIFFLKTHRTAGSTVQNIIMRFGLQHKLNFMLPRQHSYLGYRKPVKKRQIKSDITPPDGKFNIFTHHSRYNRLTNTFLYPDTVRVTILRNPADVFESLWMFYNLSKTYDLTIKQFIEQLPDTNRLRRYTRSHRITGHNQMSRDLGFNSDQYPNETAVNEFIDLIDRDFHLVMISEHIEVSLVLLANLIGWPLEYVKHLPLNQRNTFRKYKLTENQRLQLTVINRVDTRLYSHFLDKFRRCIQHYGEERMANDVRRLRILNRELENRCISQIEWVGYAETKSYKLKSRNWDCVYSTKQELEFTQKIRLKQKVRLKPVKNPRNSHEFV